MVRSKDPKSAVAFSSDSLDSSLSFQIFDSYSSLLPLSSSSLLSLTSLAVPALSGT